MYKLQENLHELILPFICSLRFLIIQYSRFTLRTFQKQIISDNSTAKFFEIMVIEFPIIVDLLSKLFTWHLLVNSKLFAIFLLRMHIKLLKLSQSNSVYSIYWINFLNRQFITGRKLNFDTDYKSGQQGLQNGAAFRDYKSGQKGS